MKKCYYVALDEECIDYIASVKKWYYEQGIKDASGSECLRIILKKFKQIEPMRDKIDYDHTQIKIEDLLEERKGQ